jgi:hypothetical protein
MSTGARSEDEKRAQIRAIVGNIWERARINAFAHKLAAEQAKQKSTILFVSAFVCSLLSVTFVILVYMISSAPSIFGADQSNALLPFLFTLLSIIFTILALGASVLSSHFKYDVAAAEHIYFLGSFQFIAQKARAVKWPDMPYENCERLLIGLEESFQLLKSRGVEPSDKLYNRAHEILEKIHSDANLDGVQSFDRDETKITSLN